MSCSGELRVVAQVLRSFNRCVVIGDARANNERAGTLETLDTGFKLSQLVKECAEPSVAHYARCQDC